jgi:serine/threonine protein kinase
VSLIGFYDPSMVRDMLKECLRMSKFNHLHVLPLKGVCLDGGPAPYIIMPFMANGSLLAYLRKNRKALVLSCKDNTKNNGEDVSSVYIQIKALRL